MRNLDARDFEGVAWWPIITMARKVAEYRARWRANLDACQAKGLDPRENGSVKESFAHFSAAQVMLSEAVAVSYTGPEGRRRTALDDLVQQTQAR